MLCLIPVKFQNFKQIKCHHPRDTAHSIIIYIYYTVPTYIYISVKYKYIATGDEITCDFTLFYVYCSVKHSYRFRIF